MTDAPHQNDDQRPDDQTADSDDWTATQHSQPAESLSAAGYPRQIGQYVLKRLIASGGMGTVFEALQENPRRPVAVKVLKNTLSGENAARRLEYEAQVLARLRHSGIAQIYEAGSYEEGGKAVPFFAMEYIPNAKSIIEYATEKALSIRDRLALFLQVCDAVHHGHQRGVVHRDLKPSNILVDSNGRVRVIDFGVARATDADMRQAAVQTEVGQIVGSVQYMSPEQFDADPHDLDTRSDVYTLGLILYKLLTGALPYTTDSGKIFDFAAEVRSGQLKALSSWDKSLRGELEAIVNKAMARDRANRYQSAFGLEQDISRYLAGDAIVARNPGVSYQFRVFARKNKPIIGLVATAFVLLIAGVIVTTSLLFKVDQERKIADEERQKAEIATAKATKGQQFLSNILTSAFPPGFGDQTTVLDILDRADQMLIGAFPDEPEIEVDLRRSLGKAYLNIGHWTEARRELESALNLSRNTLGDPHDKTLELLEDLWLTYQVMNDNQAKLENTQLYLAAISERPDVTELEILDEKAYVAAALQDVGRLSEALKMSAEVWQGLTEQLGADSSDTIYGQLRYSWYLLESGQIAQARELALDALARAERVHGPHHNRVRQVKSGLAATYLVQGKIDSAKAVYLDRAIPQSFGVEKTFQGNFDLERNPFQLLVFFETWCPFSDQAMRRIERVHRQYGRSGLDVIGLTRVTKSSTEDGVVRYLKNQEISFTAVKEDGRSWNYFDCSGTPSIRLISDGYLIWEYSGPAIDRIPTQILEGLVIAQSPEDKI